MSEAGQAAKRSWTDWKIVPTSRRATQWTFSIVGLILVLGILFLVTFLVRLNPVTWDLTEADLHSLSQQTHNVLRDLEEQVTLLGFVEGGEDPRLERMLRAYADRSARVAYRLVDPVARPALAQNYQVRRP